jgi:hypothetical protein
MRSLSSVTGGLARMTVVDGEATLETESGVVRASSGGEVARGSAVDTIRSELGVPHAGNDVKLSDLITVKGVTTTVAAARAAGFINRNGAGDWYEVGKVAPAGQTQQQTPQQQPQEPPQGTQEQQQQPAQEVIPRLDDASEGILAEYTSKVGNFALHAGLKSVIETGEIGDALAREAGSKVGLEPEQVKAHVEQVRAAFENQAREHVGQPVLEWARERKLGSLKDAARDQAISGSLKGYDALAREYFLNLPTINPHVILSSPDAKSAGVQQDYNGNITILHPTAGRVLWGAAVKAGLIGPKFAKR